MSDHFRRGRFFNPGGASVQSFWRVPKLLAMRRTPWPTQVQVATQAAPRPRDEHEIVVTFIGHATFLIQTPAGNIITDPVFAQRAGPYELVGPRRVRQPGIRFDQLPPISLVLLSHNHYDHCDLRALKAIGARVITLRGNARLLRAAGMARVEELDWWEATTHEAHLRITATPAQHFSARTPFDRNRALWGGFAVDVEGRGREDSAAPPRRRVYFAGDSGYGPHFKEIGRRLGPFDLSLIPIGAYEPRWFMKEIHMNPEDAVRAHLDAGSRRSIGMHFGTFQLTAEGIDEPVRALERARLAAGVSGEAFAVIEVGESILL